MIFIKKFFIISIITSILGCVSLKSINTYAAIGGKVKRVVNTILGRIEYGKGNYNLKDNLNIPYDLRKQSKKLIKNGYVVGVDSETFDPSLLDKLTYRNYYYQSIDNNDQLITLVSKEPPLIKNINKTMVEVTYIDESDKEQNLITHGIPHWILGMDINADIEKRKKKINKNISSKSPLLSNLVDENLKFQEETQGIEIKVPRSDTLRKSMLSDSQLNIEESVGLITDEINKQRKNDYRQLIGEGQVNYGLEDSTTKMKLN